MARYNVIKWTWFHKCWNGRNAVMQNKIIDWAACPKILGMFFEEEVAECLTHRGFTLHKRNDTSATFICKNGDYVNIRIC